MGESISTTIGLQSDRRLRLEFCGATISPMRGFWHAVSWMMPLD